MEQAIWVSPEEMQAQREAARCVREMPDRPRSYFIVTYGCQMNAHDSEILAGMMEQMGMTPASSREEAELILFNTCCIRDNAERKALGNMAYLRALKRSNPQADPLRLRLHDSAAAHGAGDPAPVSVF